MNGPVFVAAVIERKNWSSEACLVGHNNIAVVAAFNPLLFTRDTSLSPGTSNTATVLALAARSSISLWLTSLSRPLVVLHDVFERDIMDLQWSKDGRTLWASSSEGHVGVIEFDLNEFGSDLAPPGTLAKCHSTHGFVKPVRAKPLALMPNGSAAAPAQQRPPSPQKTTWVAGKRRIQPAFLGSLQTETTVFSGPAVFPTSQPQNTAPVFPVSGAPPVPQPAAVGVPVASTSASINPFVVPATAPTAAAPVRQIVSTVITQQQPAVAQPQFGEPIYASSAQTRAQLPPNMETDFALRPAKQNRAVKGATLGGSRDKGKERREVVEELAPAFIPEDGGSGDLKLAVPAVKTLGKAFLHDVTEVEAEDGSAVERLEWRNFKDGANRPSEVVVLSSVNADKGNSEKTQWLDYLEHHVVCATWNGAFGAVSTLDGGLHVYSAAGRR